MSPPVSPAATTTPAAAAATTSSPSVQPSSTDPAPERKRLRSPSLHADGLDDGAAAKRLQVDHFGQQPQNIPDAVPPQSPDMAAANRSDPPAKASPPTTTAAALGADADADVPSTADPPTTSATHVPSLDDADADASAATDANSAAPTATNPDLPAAPSQDSNAQAAQQQPLQTVQMKALIVTQDASIIIGKGGKHINEIREKAGARATISEAIPGSAERILIVQGQLDAVSKAFGLIVRRINDEPFDTPSIQGSRAVTIRFIIANARMGGVIGKAGAKIKEIQDMSGARLQASEALLPGSTERILSVSGVADAIHIAVYYIGLILLENADRQPANTVYRPGGGGRGEGSMNAGMGGAPSMGGPRNVGVMGGAPGHGMSPPQHSPYGVAPMHSHHQHPHPHAQSQQQQLGSGGYPSTANQPGSQTQQIYIPNELVGAIIGKGGQKINEIRHMSGTHIKIMEPGEGGQAAGVNERLVTITGMPPNIQAAVAMLHQKLEAERTKQLQPQPMSM